MPKLMLEAAILSVPEQGSTPESVAMKDGSKLCFTHEGDIGNRDGVTHGSAVFARVQALKSGSAFAPRFACLTVTLTINAFRRAQIP